MSSPIRAGRACKGCTLCCKLMEVRDLEKPFGEWCRHCDIGVGCKIYSDRPHLCAGFHCGYLTMPELNEAWWPHKSKIIVAAEKDPDRIAIYVDPGRPDAWRKEPYFSKIKEWAAILTDCDKQVVVYLGRRVIVVLPNKEVDLGPIEDGDLILTRRIPTPFGYEYEASKG